MGRALPDYGGGSSHMIVRFLTAGVDWKSTLRGCERKVQMLCTSDGGTKAFSNTAWDDRDGQSPQQPLIKDVTYDVRQGGPRGPLHLSADCGIQRALLPAKQKGLVRDDVVQTPVCDIGAGLAGLICKSFGRCRSAWVQSLHGLGISGFEVKASRAAPGSKSVLWTGSINEYEVR